MSIAPEVVPQGGTGESETDARYNRMPFEDMSEGQMVQLNDRWFQRSTAVRAHVERTTLLNLAFFLGQQYVGLPEGSVANRLVSKSAPKGRVRTTENLIVPAVRAEIARLLRTRPTGTTLPLGDDPEDIEAASAGDDLLQHVRREHDRERYTEEAVMWSVLSGKGHVGLTWDPMATDRYGNQGDFEFRSLSPYDFAVPRLRESDMEKQPYVMVTKLYELDEIEDRWGVRVTADGDATATALDDRLTGIIRGTQSIDPTQAWSSSGTDKHEIEAAVVKETWVRPSRMAPEGAVLITAGGHVLDLVPWPRWTKGRYPFAGYPYISVPGSYWGRGLVNDLIPIQRRHNRAISIGIELMNMYAMLGIAAPKNSKVKGVMGGRAYLLETPLGATQSALNIQPPQVGDLPWREIDNTRQAFRDIASQHEVSRGHTPPNVRSGTAINLLKEIDDSSSTIALRGIERAEEKLGRHILEVVRQEWTEPRMVMVLGIDGDIERRSFITGNEISGEYVVQTGSAWPYSKAEKINSVLDLFERGLLEPGEALEHLDLGVTSATILKGRNEDKRHARRENQKFEELTAVLPDGQVDIDMMIDQARDLAPEMWHNHMVHVDEHNRLRKSARYETWPVLKTMLFEAHIEGHMLALQQQLMAQMRAEDPSLRPQPEGEGE